MQDVSFSFQYTPIVRLSLRVGEGSSVRVELTVQDSCKHDLPATGKWTPQGVIAVVDGFDAKRGRGASGAAQEEAENGTATSSALKEEGPRWYACAWVQCDRCERWRRV